MSDEPTVYEIDVTKKYILLIDGLISSEHYARIKHTIQQWVESPNEPFLILSSPGVKLVKVSDD